MSQATIAVAGAAMVLSTLPGARAGFNRAFASGEVTKTNRPGEPLALVGPSRASWTTWRSRSAGTGFGSQAVKVRASRKIWSIEASGRGLPGVNRRAAGAVLMGR